MINRSNTLKSTKHTIKYAKITIDNRVINGDVSDSILWNDRMTMRHIQYSKENGYTYVTGFNNLLTYNNQPVLAILVLYINNEWLLEIIV
jgi:hypothetical protein